MSFRVAGGSIGSGVSFRWDGWSWPGGPDMGAQYFSAHPFSPWHDGKLVITEQNKMLGGDNHYYYGFRITNEGPQSIQFQVEGGGFN